MVSRIAHRLQALGRPDRFGTPIANERSGLPHLRHAVQQPGRERGQTLLVGQIQALRQQAFIAEQGARQRNARVRRAQRHPLPLGHGPGLLHGVDGERLDRHRRIADAVHERRVGPVLQQAPHQIGQQRLVRAHRRIHPAGTLVLAGRDLLVQRLAHAVQALELELPAVVVVACEVVDARRRLRVVRGELRIDRIRRRQQLARAGQIGHIAVHLARIDRVAFHPVDLRALDLAVPVRPLDQPHHQAVAAAACQIDEPGNHMRAALLVGLHHKADAVPARQLGRKAQRLQNVERQLQPVGLLGVDVHPDVVLARQHQQPLEPGQQLGHHQLLLRAAVARMQRRELDRDAWPLVDAPAVARLPDRLNRLLVEPHIGIGIFHGRGRLTQHVVAVAEALGLELAAVGQRLADGLPRHELLAHEPHRHVHTLAHQRLATRGQQAGQRLAQRGLAAGAGELAGDEQAPGRRIHEQ